MALKKRMAGYARHSHMERGNFSVSYAAQASSNSNRVHMCFANYFIYVAKESTLMSNPEKGVEFKFGK